MLRPIGALAVLKGNAFDRSALGAVAADEAAEGAATDGAVIGADTVGSGAAAPPTAFVANGLTDAPGS